jgi:hypothetical protein
VLRAAHLRLRRRENLMRAIGVFLGAVMIVALSGCGNGGQGGSGGNGGGGGSDGFDETSCNDCSSAWDDDIDDCGSAADICAGSADDLHDFGPCFRAYGTCLSDSYDDASICMEDCGDYESASALSCGSYCEFEAGYCYGDAADGLADCYDYCESSSCFDDCDFYYDLDAETCEDDRSYCLQDCGL